ncbi:putative ThiF-like ubiquitin-activating enzyme [Hamiltosporidium magnivora]|uniref:Putative ThiF-like ubiquitin-activating enzyme n=1 Tax=Hamiltosporidium magnivora TaxID=148818 RepID=A0A4Q9LB66_9MICR|nr:putative ThiF-like ubiquitin-activating enzyme [Hamiltosporidium magnivora]
MPGAWRFTIVLAVWIIIYLNLTLSNSITNNSKILFLTLNNTNNNTTNNGNTTSSTNNLTYNSIIHLPLKVGKETESVFSDTFLTNTSLVVNALYNIETRLYVDKRCITNKIPLFESGTLGTKGNVQSYSSRDPPDKSIPLCTLRKFPHCIEHSIEWALALSVFKSNFEEKIISISEYIKGVNFMDSKLEGDNDSSSNYRGVDYGIDLEQDPVNDSINKQHPLNTIHLITPYILLSLHMIILDIRVLVSSILKNIYECVREGVILFNKYFYINIETLIETFAVGHDDCLHVLFVQSYCRVISSVYGIKGLQEEGVSYKEVEDIIREVMYDKNMLEEGVNDKGSNIKGVCKRPNKEHPLNNSTRNYKIKEVSKLTVKGKEGGIIPAIATTTSVISGYVLYGNGYKNWYVNLGLSFIGCTDVIEAENMECGMVRYDNREGGVNDRDRLEGVGDSNGLEGVNYSTNTLHLVNTNTLSLVTVNYLKHLNIFKRVWNLDISMVTIRDTVVFCTFYDNERFKNNLEKFISELCCMKEGDGINYCSGECPFDIDGYNFPEDLLILGERRGRY